MPERKTLFQATCLSWVHVLIRRKIHGKADQVMRC